MWITWIRHISSLTALTAYSYLYFSEFFSTEKYLDAQCFLPDLWKWTTNKIHARSGKLSKHPDCAKIALLVQLQSRTEVSVSHATGLKINKKPFSWYFFVTKTHQCFCVAVKTRKGKRKRRKTEKIQEKEERGRKLKLLLPN